MRTRASWAPALLTSIVWVACSTPESGSPPEAEIAIAAAPPIAPAGSDGLGEGFVVWESNRSGRWRLWRRELEGGEARQLTPEEGRRLHCCPHISPDGQHIVYLSLPPDQDGYPRGGAVGALMLMGADGSVPQVLVEGARNYYENRAAVWRSPGRLNFITGDGRSAELNLETGETTLLTREASETGPWLLDSTQTWGASGNGAFAPYDAGRRQVLNRGPQPGCQPYFSHDGVWGFWVVAPGGPIHRFHLESGRDTAILKKSDDRLPAEFGYLYFPMLSADGQLLAFAASNDVHDHFRADYEVFVAETDPASLELIGQPVRITHHPSTDRFPDVHLAPLPLGRWRGEAPLSWKSPGDGGEEEWQWDYGDGTSSTGILGEHVYERPGRYQVSARRHDQTLRGQVVVSPAAPPTILSTSVTDNGHVIAVAFDEAIDISQSTIRLESGLGIDDLQLDRGNRRLRLSLARTLTGPDTLLLDGIRDRAQRPNALASSRLGLDLPAWPVSGERLAFLWETADAVNLVWDPLLGAETAVTLTPKGAARLDSNFAMLPAGGRFEATETDSRRTILECKKTYEITIEMRLERDRRAGEKSGVVITSASRSRRNFTLEQQGGRLFLTLRMKSRGERAFPRLGVVDLPDDRPAHVVLTYSPGHLDAYLDGERVTSETSPEGGFFHWRPAPLIFGADWNGQRPWQGRLEGVAIWSRALDAEEVRESYRRYRSKVEARGAKETWTALARLQACAATPTLEQIDPYREALVVCQYSVDETLTGSELPARIAVARWSMLDGQPIRAAGESGGPIRLHLGRFDDNPQLESVYLSDTLEAAMEGPLFFLLTP